MKTYSYDDIFRDKQSIVFFTAHPDDVIVFFAALIHTLRKDGKDVYVVTVTNGARGSRKSTVGEEELAQTRLQEEKNALAILNVPATHMECLNYKDGEVESNLKLIGEVTHCIRKWKADIVCTHDPAIQYLQTYDKSGYFVQHRDHRKIGEAVIDAVYPFARDRSFFTDQYKDGVEPRSVYDILLTDESGSNFEIDHTDEVDIKRQALMAHKTQLDEEKANDILNAFAENGRNFEKFQYLKLLW